MQFLTGQEALGPSVPTRVSARRAVALFPVVGAIIGVLLAAVWTIAGRLWAGEPLVAAALVVAIGAWITGGKSLDGLARAGDGWAALGNGGDRSRVFAVMRDPRRGAAGLSVLALLLILKTAFLTALPASAAVGSIVLAAALNRWASAFAYSAFPLAAAASDDPETHAGLSSAGPNEFLIATVIAVACAALIPIRGLLTMIAVAAIIGAAAGTLNRRLGGLNTPLCQALGEFGEVAALVCLTVNI